MKLASLYLSIGLFCIVVGLVGAGCAGTVHPSDVVIHEGGFSGNDENGGFKGYTTNGLGVIGSTAHDKYNALVDVYGKRFMPPIKEEFGIAPYTNGTYTITKEALSDFAIMNHWWRNGQKTTLRRGHLFFN